MRIALRIFISTLILAFTLPPLFAQNCVCSGFNSSRADSGWALPDGEVFARARGNLSDPALFGSSGVVNRTILIGGGVMTATPSTLAGFNVFFTGWTQTATYTAAEKTALMNAVNSGMSMVVTTDDTAHNISDLFGVTLENDLQAGINTTAIPDHPIFSGPFGRISQYRGSENAGHYRAWPAGTLTLATSASGPSMLLIPRATLSPTAGAVLFISDVDVLTTSTRDISTNTSDPSVPVTDALVMNIVNFLCVPNAESVAPHIVLPQIADGAGNTSSLVLTSTSAAPVTNTVVSFRDDNGAPLSLSIVGQGSATNFNIGNLEQNRTNTYDTPGVGILRSGTAVVRGSPLLAANVIFSLPNVGVTGVGASEVAGGFDIPVVPQPASGGPRDILTGLALSNMSSKTGNVRLELWDATGRRSDGITFITIPGFGHTARFLFQIYPNFVFTGFKGTLRVVSANTLLAATALQIGSQAGQFSALPVKPLY
jgi:hypothetical protein